MNLVHVAAPLFLLGDVLALGTVGMVVRRRTRWVRRGTPPLPRPEHIGGALPTSRTTNLAWLGGAAAGLWAVSLGGRAALALGPAAAFVAGSGLTLRVTALEVDDRALTVHYAARAPRRLRWDRCRSLRPPRSPLGAWRIEAGDATASLMPSDVLGNEPILSAVARRGSLAFDGGAWRRPNSDGVSPRR